MILRFHDIEGDLVAIDSRVILAVRLGRLEGGGVVTLISLPSCTIAVREPANEVMEMWRAARFPSSADKPSEVSGWRYHPIVEGIDR